METVIVPCAQPRASEASPGRSLFITLVVSLALAIGFAFTITITVAILVLIALAFRGVTSVVRHAR